MKTAAVPDHRVRPPLPVYKFAYMFAGDPFMTVFPTTDLALCLSSGAP